MHMKTLLDEVHKSQRTAQT